VYIPARGLLAAKEQAKKDKKKAVEAKKVAEETEKKQKQEAAKVKAKTGACKMTLFMLCWLLLLL